ncbi:MAG: mechanosensitive ion channel domain-containing protein [Pseudomonadota bacterium]
MIDTMTPRLCARQACSVLLGLAALLLSPAVIAQDENSFDPLTAGNALNDLALQLDAAPEDPDILSATRSAAAQIAADAGACRAQWTSERERLEDRYAPLEEVTGDVAPAVFDQRLEVRQLLDQAIARQSACVGVEDDATALIDRVTAIQNRIAQQYLSYRGESLLTAARDFPARLRDLPAQLRQSNELSLNEGLQPVNLFWLLIVSGIVAAALGVHLRRRFQRWYGAAGGSDAEPSLRYLFPKPLAQYSPSLLSGAAFVGVLYVSIQSPSLDLLVVRLAVGILLFGLGAVAVAWATGALSPAASVRGLIPDHVGPLRFRLRIVVLALVSSFVVLGPNWSTIRLIEPGAGGRSVMILLVGLSLLFLIAYLGKIPGLRQRFQLLRLISTFALIVGIVAVLFGYQNFAGYMIHGVTRSAIALFVLWVLVWLVSTTLGNLLRDDGGEASLPRGAARPQTAVSRSSIGFMQLVADLVLWVSVISYLIYVWDESGTTLDRLIDLLVRGGRVGEIQLVPAQIIAGIVIFAALLIIIGWIKRWIDRRWLQHIVMERGAREALITLFGYVAFIIALLVGLTQAGVDLRGLAIVSGALALGIGFGLQEIANNFVSGLILLFERPIRAGDFVTVGDIEGFVRKISIRATEIETLDNQNVLVPNSELVSGRVTNWVLRDPHGRIRLEIGVAYGSDVETVRDILEEVACAHSEVITDGRAPAPRALFMGFGDSSLDFELRCRINRIDRRFSVASDLNFAIDAAFREAGVSIPFPQRDLHIVSYPETAAEQRPKKSAAEESGTQRLAALPETAVTRQLVQEVTIRADIKDIWEAITDAERLTSWFGGTVELAPYIGGAYRWTNGNGGVTRGRIDVFIPPQRMRLVQLPPEGEDPLPTGPITVLFALATDDKKCRLTVTVSGIPATEEWEQDYNRSQTLWQNVLLEIQESFGSK